MRVITLVEHSFANHCKSLETLSGAFRPDLIAGIANGGVIVAGQMFRGLPHVSINARRPSSRFKGRLFGVLLKPLTRKMKDRLRIIESKHLAKSKKVVIPAITLDKETAASIKKATRILIVDDAVDSGRTLDAVITVLRTVNPGADIASAAITVTTECPLAMPDYYIYNDRTLIRFPWSKDR